MADLPDIDPSQTSYIAYWNAIDNGGVSSVDPTDVTSNGNVENYDLYDNGLQGKYNIGGLMNKKDRTVNFRVKNDGWFVFWFGTTSVAETQQDDDGISTTKGHYDLVHDWTEPKNGSARLNSNTLARAINNLRQSTSNSGKMTFNYSDVGLYEYQTDATAVTAVGDSNLASDETLNTSHSFSYTNTTTIYDAYVMGSIQSESFGSEGSMSFEGITLADSSGWDGGSIDLFSNDNFLQPGTDITTNSSIYSAGGASNAWSHASAFIAWG